MKQKENSINNKENDNKIIGWGIFVTFIIIGLWIATYFLLKDCTPDDRGTLGDMFGTINALFSGLALGGIIFTILLQRKELSYQRDELRETRKEFVVQNKTLMTQRFENTFFQLLSNHAEIVSSIDLRKKNPTTRAFEITSQGRDCIKIFYERFANKCQVYCNEKQMLLKEIDIEDALKIYMDIYHSNQADLGHYFRNMYHILKFISEEAKNDNKKIINKKRYSNLLRAQLSSYELALLFYNGIGEYGVEKFKDYIVEFDFLKNLDKGLIISKKHLDMYPEKTLGLKN